MANKENSVLIRIAEELKQFPFVHPLTRMVALSILDKTGPERQVSYLNETIPFLRRLFGDITHPIFANACAALARNKSPESLTQFLGETDSHSWFQWIRHAHRRAASSAVSLVCVANDLALPFDSPLEHRATATDLGARGLVCFRPATAVRWLESFVGLCPKDYEQAEDADAKFEKLLEQGLSADCVSCIAATLGYALYAANRPADAVIVLEQFVGLSNKDYEHPEIVDAQLEKQLKQPLTHDNAACFTANLANGLNFVNRNRDALMLLERFVGLSREDYRNPDVVGLRLKKELKERLLPDNAASFAYGLADSLRGVDRAADACIVLESFVDLRLEDYKQPEVVGVVLDEKLKKVLAIDNAANFTETLAHAHLFENRAVDAVVVLEQFLRLCRADYERPEDLKFRLAIKLKHQLALDNATTFVQTFAKALMRVGRAPHAVMVMELFVGLDPKDFKRPEVIETKMKELRESQLQQNNAIGLLWTFANALCFDDRAEDAWILLERGTVAFSLIDSDEMSLTVQNVAGLVLIALRSRQKEVGEVAGIVERFIRWSRRQLDRHNVSTANRIQLLENIRTLRSAVIGLADRVSLEMNGRGDLAGSKQWRERGLRWDAELGQRVLLERILEPLSIPIGSEAVGLWEGPIWPMRDELRPSWGQHYRPRIYEEVVSTNCALEAVEQTPTYATNMNTVQTQMVPPEVAARWRQAIDVEPTPETLANILGEDVLLIRSNFAPTGQICWTTFLSRGGELKLIDHDHGSSSTNARSQIVQALSDHECRIAFAYLPDEKREAIAKLILRTDFQVFGDQEAVVEALGSKLNNFAIQAIALAGGSVGMAMAKRLKMQMLAAIETNATDRIQDRWITLQQLWLDALRNSSCTQAINAATAQLIEEVGHVWNLDSLAEHLSPKLDVVVMADEILGCIPISLLRCGKKELFRQVRSVRSTLSVMLDQFAAMAEAEADTAPKAPLAAVSYFAEGDRARIGAADLHHGLMHLAEQHGYALALAADQPLGTVDHVHRACANDQGLSVLVTYGHGSVEQSCVLLGPDGRPFQGRGCRLSQVEFPQLISCSVGQNRSSGAHDFEGLSCELARAGARAALVAVWPIHSLQAAHFSNEVTHQYLKLRKQYPAQGSELTEKRLRALAVNLARREVLKEQDEQGKPKYLNTVAAFSLLGLA